MFPKRYEIHFEFYGKKMKTNVMAINEECAKLMVKDKIIFHKVEDKSRDIADVMKAFMDVFGKK